MSEDHFKDKAPTNLSEATKKKIFFGVVGVIVVIMIIVNLSSGEPPKEKTTLANVNKAEPINAIDKSFEDNQKTITVDKPKKKETSDIKGILSRGAPPPAPKDYNPNQLESSPSDGSLKLFDRNAPQGPVNRKLRAADQRGYNKLAAAGIAPPQGAATERRAGSSVKITDYVPPAAIQTRMHENYQAVVEHFKKVDPWIQDAEIIQAFQNPDLKSLVDAPLQNLYDNAEALQAGMTYDLPSGTRIIAVTDQKVNTDHPGFFTSRIVRPHILAGAKLICQAGANQNDRIPVRPVKVIFGDGSELALTGQVETDFAGLDGEVTSHYWARLGPAVGNAAIGGAFLAWSMSRETGEDRIDTRDAITAPVVASTVTGVQDEITRLGGDYPNTVEVEAGKQFSILLTEPLKVVR